jgi:subtilisin family serine protease
VRRLVPAALAVSLLIPGAGAAAQPTADSAATGVPTRGDVTVLVTLDDRVPDVAAAARAALPAGARAERTWSSVLKGFSATVPAQAVAALERAPGVRRVERDIVVRASAVQPSPPLGLDRVDQRSQPLNSSYTFTRTGSGVTAYVVDTGIRLSHSDFGGRAVSGIDAVEPGTSADDCDGHGTHVAGTVGGSRFGIAKSVRLSAVRVLGCDGAGSGSDLITGLDFVVRDHAAGTPAVAVLSLGGATTSTTVDDAVRRVIADGVSVAVAAGNENIDACTISPARVGAALTVGASDPTTDRRASFSNVGSCLDLFAPGVGILSAGHTGDTDTLISSGTSMAAPHVAGGAALLLEARPSASPAEVADQLRTQATQGVVVDGQSGAADDVLFVDGGGSVLPAPSPSPSPSPSASPSPSPSPSGGALLPQPPQSTDDVAGRFTPLTPSRVLDSRDGTGGVSGRLEPGRPVTVDVTGRGGVPPAGVTAVVINITVTGPATSGHVTVYPAGGSVPVASNLNYSRGQTIANLVVTGVDGQGRIALVSSGGRPLVIGDVVGYYSDTLGGSRSAAVTPFRLLDTRTGLGGTTGRLPGAQAVSLQVAGRGGVPAGATAAVLNVTAVSPLGGGHLTAFPGGTAAPDASNLNFLRSTTVPNLVVVGLGSDGTVQLRASGGSPHVLADVVGWYGDEGRSRFVPVQPERLLDTRDSGRRLSPGEEVVVQVGGRASLPGLGVTAVLVNVTATGATGSGHLTVFPADAQVPQASNVNYRQGQTVPNLVLSGVTVEGGQLRIRSNAGSPHVLVDVVGYTTEAPPAG